MYILVLHLFRYLLSPRINKDTNQNPEWGVRDLEDVITVAAAQNLVLQQIKPMPANNLSVIFKRLD